MPTLISVTNVMLSRGWGAKLLDIAAICREAEEKRIASHDNL
jgi:hypothetical protein